MIQNVGDDSYLNNAAVNAVVGMPQSSVIPPLPDRSLCRLGAALLQHYINCKDALSRQAGHQLTSRRRRVVSVSYKTLSNLNSV